MNDVPLTDLRWRCARCGSRHPDFVCACRDAAGVKPWRRRQSDLCVS